MVHDMLGGPLSPCFDAVFALEVFEQIGDIHRDKLIANMVQSLLPHGACVVGAVSMHSQGCTDSSHIDCTDHETVRSLMRKYFHNVFVLAMPSDGCESPSPLPYYFAICTDRKPAMRLARNNIRPLINPKL
jgi:hypothetical protein